jgi:hypothetical protein
MAFQRVDRVAVRGIDDVRINVERRRDAERVFQVLLRDLDGHARVVQQSRFGCRPDRRYDRKGWLMFLVTVGLSFGLYMAAPQPVAVRPAVTLDAKVAGRVVDGVSRRPIADATVMLVPTVHQFPAGAINTTAITDANGKFSIQPLPSGRYRVYVRKTGFARVPDASNAQTIDVGAGQSVTDIELALHAGATIAGRILDASGRLALSLTVSAYGK